MSLADLITLTALLSISPAVKEAASALIHGDQKGMQRSSEICCVIIKKYSYNLTDKKVLFLMCPHLFFVLFF